MIEPDDRIEITELISMHGDPVDAGHLDRLGEVFTTDVFYDVTPMGAAPIEGLDGLVAAAHALGDRNPVGHHITNVVLTSRSADHVHAPTKAIGIYADGSCGSLTYEEAVVRTAAGWRIARRKIVRRRAPLGR